MRIECVAVEGFRSLGAQNVPLHGRLTVLEGDNGQGKTNFLEAVYLLAALRSFRTNRLSECIAWGQESARVVGVALRRGGRTTIEVRIFPRARRVIVDGKPLSSAREYRGDLGAVLFTVEDLEVARGSPGGRRRLVDRAVYAAAPAHLADIVDYERALRARNVLLREDRARGLAAEAHEEAMAEVGARVLWRRILWVEAMRAPLRRIFREVAAIDEEPGIHYEPSTPGVREGAGEAEIRRALVEGWRASRDADLARGFTGIGPHADDVALTLGDRPLRVAGSQGQQRAFVVSLKLAEVGEVERALGEPPVLLLDDVGSELDLRRRTTLFSALDRLDCQVVVTTPLRALVPLSGTGETYRVAGGHLQAMHG